MMALPFAVLAMALATLRALAGPATIPSMPDAETSPAGNDRRCPKPPKKLLTVASLLEQAEVADKHVEPVTPGAKRGSSMFQVSWSGGVKDVSAKRGQGRQTAQRTTEGLVDVTLKAGERVLIKESAKVGTLTIEANAELVFDDAPGLTLQANGIIVKGTLTMGSEECPLTQDKIGIVLTGTPPDSGMHAEDLKGIVVKNKGTLDIHGKRFMPTWTRLSKTAEGGDRSLHLAQRVNWLPGQQLAVITSAVAERQDRHENEERTIVSVSDDGTVVELDSPLQHSHYAGDEYAAEVALLSRQVFIRGDENSKKEEYGGHTLCHKGSKCRISSVEASLMGQRNVMGRYPFHMHLMEEGGAESYFEDNSAHDTFFRAFTVHGTKKARLSRNVAYNIMGTAFYLEDGSEEENLFEFNLAALVNPIKPLNDYGKRQQGQTIKTEKGRIVPTDATAAGFYISNAGNSWIGNSASGGFSGFHFVKFRSVLGKSSKISSLKKGQPDARELLKFDGNTAHSSGSFWVHGACIYAGGELTESPPASEAYTYVSGRTDTPRAGMLRLTNTKVFACNRGVNFWGSTSEHGLRLEYFEVHDSAVGTKQLGKTSIIHGLFNGHSGNMAKDVVGRKAMALQLYDTAALTIFNDVEFANYNEKDICIQDMVHSNVFKPQGLFTASKVKYTNVNTRITHDSSDAGNGKGLCDKSSKDKGCVCEGTSGASMLSNMASEDGSLIGGDWPPGSGAIVGSDDVTEAMNDWWKVDSDCRQVVGISGMLACPTHGTRKVVSVSLVGGTGKKAQENAKKPSLLALKGKMHHLGSEDRFITAGFAGSPQLTGVCCDFAWYYRPYGDQITSNEKTFSIFLDQMVTGSHGRGLVFVTDFPAGARIQVTKWQPQATCKRMKTLKTGERVCPTKSIKLHEEGSVDKVLKNKMGERYHVSKKNGVARLYLKLVDEGNGELEADGLKLLLVGRGRNQGVRYEVTSSKKGKLPKTIPDEDPEIVEAISSMGLSSA